MTSIALPTIERFHPRVEANFMVKILVGSRLLLAKAKDLSMAGLYLLGFEADEGASVTLAIPLPEDREVVTSARVRRRHSDGVAIQFDTLDWEDLFAMARFLHPRLP